MLQNCGESSSISTAVGQAPAGVDELVQKVEVAVQNRKKLQELLVEAGRRYVNALKAQRKRR